MKLKDLAKKLDNLPKKLVDNNFTRIMWDLQSIDYKIKNKDEKIEFLECEISKIYCLLDNTAKAFEKLRNIIMECEIENG